MIDHHTDSCQLFDGDIGPSHVAFTSRTVLREEEGHGTSTPLIKMSLWRLIKRRQIVSDLSFELGRGIVHLLEGMTLRLPRENADLILARPEWVLFSSTSNRMSNEGARPSCVLEGSRQAQKSSINCCDGSDGSFQILKSGSSPATLRREGDKGMSQSPDTMHHLCGRAGGTGSRLLKLERFS